MAAVVAGRAMCVSVSSAVTASAMPFAVRGPALRRLVVASVLITNRAPATAATLLSSDKLRQSCHDPIIPLCGAIATLAYCSCLGKALSGDFAVVCRQRRLGNSSYMSYCNSSSGSHKCLRTLVVLGRFARREDLDGREALDAELAARRLVGLRVAVDSHHVDDAVQRLRHLLVRRRQALAVSAPAYQPAYRTNTYPSWQHCGTDAPLQASCTARNQWPTQCNGFEPSC